MYATNHELLDTYGTELELFGIWMKNQGMTASTERAYKADVGQYLAMLHPAPLEQSTKLDIMRYLSRTREAGAGDEARNRKLSSLRAFYKALNEMEQLNVNPAALTAKSRQQKNRIPVYLEEEQLQLLFEHVEGKHRERNLSILLLMSYAGLRVGEIHRLNRHDLTSEGMLSVLGKGRKWRYLPLPSSLARLLLQMMETSELKMKQGKEQPMFVSQLGRRLSIRMIQNMADSTLSRLQASLPELSMKKLSSHKLRHSFATMQIRSGTDIRTLQELLGHASIETTQIYTHIDNKQLREAMDSVAGKIPTWVKRG
ncbi:MULTISPECIES: tyrosine-type recombinase/integrase [unclassified Paenibacillus]|uniref:tyrosine-type recombinase/integrase n=1 Tax=unclassified Paenibacillus TaxID=185978 RepID=UPI000954EB34|nr:MULTISPECIES: tyrosine-type recombinase/integrase [unclassified Paenibacillus]SIQ39940.1 Site-specific recombinase XerD [Paenibacillus sp. RU4X]SIQ62119.1 Site-specific recombinase XerD [Paenibacillus sp. RU4T]